MTTEERLESLEREIARAKRRNRWVLAAVGLGALTWTVMGAALAGGPSPQAVPVGKAGPAVDKIADPQPGAVVPKVIRATEFIAEDGNGKTRARLFTGKDGPGLVLLDENGNDRAVLNVSKGGPTVRLADANGRSRATLQAWNNMPALLLAHENGGVCAVLMVFKEGPGLDLLDENGQTRARLRVSKGGSALCLSDENGKTRAEVGAGSVGTPDGKTIIFPESSARLWGPDGNNIWHAP